MFLGDGSRVVSILHREVNHPTGEQEADCHEKCSDCDVGNVPAGAGIQIFELPDSEEHEGDVAEP